MIENTQFFAREPIFFSLREILPSVGRIKIGIATFHGCAQMAEVSSTIMKSLVDTESIVYGRIVKTLINWNKLTGKGEGSIGAQKTFHVLYQYVQQTIHQ